MSVTRGNSQPPPPGKVERAVLADLRKLPEDLSGSALALSARLIAQRLDAGMATRDMVAAGRELRVTLAELRSLAPAGDDDDVVDELEQRRRERIERRQATSGQ